MIDRIFTLLGRFPAPYYVGHATVALLIFAAVFLTSGDALAAALAGGMFYVGREVRDREKLGYWDWPGLIAPVVTMLVIFSTIPRG